MRYIRYTFIIKMNVFNSSWFKTIILSDPDTRADVVKSEDVSEWGTPGVPESRSAVTFMCPM